MTPPFLVSRRQISFGRSPKNLQAKSAGQGIGTFFALQGLKGTGASGKKIPARGFLGLVRERPGAQRSISADFDFWLLCIKTK